MRVFIDTSAFLSVLDAGEATHKKAVEVWERLINIQATIVCTNYILVETFSLLQRRAGMKIVKRFSENVLPMVVVEWVDEALHKSAEDSFLTTSRKGLSFVDCVSFKVMRKLGIRNAFAFDKHFAEQGFKCIA